MSDLIEDDVDLASEKNDLERQMQVAAEQEGLGQEEEPGSSSSPEADDIAEQ